MTDMTTGASTLDCRGLICPLPVLKLTRAIREHPVGAVLELLATDPGAPADIEAFEKQSGHKLLATSEAGGVFRFLVQRAR
jgi:tRNA 2-thiouridine synthesizing protein A